MIKLNVYGSSAEIQSVIRILHRHFQSTYCTNVEEHIPECYKYLANKKRMEVSFSLYTNYFNVKELECDVLIESRIQIEVHNNGVVSVFMKPRHSLSFKGSTKRILNVESMAIKSKKSSLSCQTIFVSPKTDIESLDYYDDLEHWEMLLAKQRA